MKVVQELLLHGLARIIMDIYAEAMTPAKRQARRKMVAMLRETRRRAERLCVPVASTASLERQAGRQLPDAGSRPTEAAGGGDLAEDWA